MKIKDSYGEDGNSSDMNTCSISDKIRFASATTTTFQISEPQRQRKPTPCCARSVLGVYLLLLTGGQVLLAYKVFTMQREILKFQEQNISYTEDILESSFANKLILERNSAEKHMGHEENWRRSLEEEIAIIKNSNANLMMMMSNISLVAGRPGRKGDPGPPGMHQKSGVVLAGLHGVQGEKGSKGDPGPAGPSGEPGVRGEKGDAGLAGLQGQKGEMGKKGDPGPRGPMGLQGHQGIPGLPGFNGKWGGHSTTHCITGQRGPVGSPGLEGKPGQKGEKGDLGPSGSPGTMLLKHVTHFCLSVFIFLGPPGQKGAKGDEGLPGIPGPTGQKGSKGDYGSHGPKGDPGVKGAKGDPGLPGSPGTKGSKGEKGQGLFSSSIRIAEGGRKGRVEIFHDGSWGTICDDGWSTQDATVVCRMLGYSRAISAFTATAGSGQIWLDDVNCSGSENSIFDCPKPNWGVHNCSHGEDAGVECV
ncbi:MARCO protein, partial [Rostratula benghalensis]|nr:MARCO protein [Rostratula benghalensis]